MSVEQLLDARFAGQADRRGQRRGARRVRYEAKAFGIPRGCPGGRARRLCPRLAFIGGHFREYQRLGDAVIDVLCDFTPLVERISIDEAFLDVAGSVHL